MFPTQVSCSSAPNCWVTVAVARHIGNISRTLPEGFLHGYLGGMQTKREATKFTKSCMQCPKWVVVYLSIAGPCQRDSKILGLLLLPAGDIEDQALRYKCRSRYKT